MAFKEVRYNDDTKTVKTVKSYNASKPSAGNFTDAMGAEKAASQHLSMSEWKLLTSPSANQGSLRLTKFGHGFEKNLSGEETK